MIRATRAAITVVASDEKGQVTGLSGEDPGLVWLAEQCQSNRVPFDPLIRHVEQARDLGPAYFRQIGEALAASAGGPPDRAAIAEVMRRHGLTPARPSQT